MPHCSVCGKFIGRADNLYRHERTHSVSGGKRYECSLCSYSTDREGNLKRHSDSRHRHLQPLKRKIPNVSTIWRPWEQSSHDAHSPPSPSDNSQNPILQSGIHDASTRESPDDNSILPDGDLGADDPDDAFIALLRDNEDRIRTYAEKSRRPQDRYNFKMVYGNASELEGFLAEIWREQKYAFKLNLSFGFILQNIYTDEYVFYYASRNNRLFESPKVITDKRDLATVMQHLDTADLLEYCRQQRPNTKFIVRKITNAYFYVDKLKKFGIGCTVNLPDFVKLRHSLANFVNNRQGRPYADNLCFFRCLAFFYDRTYVGIDERARALFRQYSGNNFAANTGFEGVDLHEMGKLEDTFRLDIEVFELKERSQMNDSSDREDDEDEESASEYAVKIYASTLKYGGEPLRLNLHGNHFSLIVNFGAFVRRWACCKCQKLFATYYHMTVHARSCSSCTRIRFPGGGYGLKKNLFDRLREHGVTVDSDLRFYPFRLAYDFESFCTPAPPLPATLKKEKIVGRLEPASVSVSSNVPGYDSPKCIISNGDPMELICQLYSYIIEISTRAYEIMQDRFAPIIEQLQMELSEIDALEIEMDMVDEDEDPGILAELKDSHARAEVYVQLDRDLRLWMSRIVCLGFNSGKFDINLIRKYLFPYFIRNGTEVQHIIKRQSDYLSITTEHAVFLDIKNYLAAGTSYDKWLQAYGVRQRKSCFPHSWFTDLSKLEQTTLPPHAEFWSSLKQSNISQEDYMELQAIWVDNNFQTMRDLLIYYNNCDVHPFLEAAEKLFQYWISLGIDPFKGNAISLPGLALNYLVKETAAHTVLPVFEPLNKDIYYLIRRNVVGGLSVVMHRYHERGVAVLPNGQSTSVVYSFDCNSLYLWALGMPTGTGLMMRWLSPDIAHESLPWLIPRDDPERLQEQRWWEVLHRNMACRFYREKGQTGSKMELEWLEWYSHTHNCAVEHKFNGRQKIVIFSKAVRFPVDGYVPSTGLILQFHGCLWHGHGCSLDRNDRDISLARRERTRDVTRRLESLNYRVIEKWECEWVAEKRADRRISDFLHAHVSTVFSSSSVLGYEMVTAVENGTLFGLIECDVEVPPWDTNAISWFSEFPPICKNVDISIDDIGEHMANYARRHGYMRQPKRNLINSYWARRILLTTPILAWYLKNGLKVTRIYQFIEMKPKACFSGIPDKVAQRRREADLDPSLKAAAESWKTLGNSLYGKAMTNKERHKETQLVADAGVGSFVNDRRFHKMEEVGDAAYEVSMDKKSILMDLPIIVALFVYNYGKMRMLEFVYDFMKKYLRPGSYQMVCSDTDSIIAAYESADIDELVKPDMWTEYSTVGKKAFLSHDLYSTRTPGLFKLELKATGIVSLCSKTYFAWDDDDGSSKTSTKGLSKRTNTYTKDAFLTVLQTQTKGSGTNHGFRMVGQTLCQYEQEREGLAYLYLKRIVQADGVSTEPLNS